jgi:hypothetical protein
MTNSLKDIEWEIPLTKRESGVRQTEGAQDDKFAKWDVGCARVHDVSPAQCAPDY